MKLLLCGSKNDCTEFINQNERLIKAALIPCDNEEELLIKMKEDSYDSVVVLVDGAEGMEAVITVRRLRPELPVIWFSDDKGFAAQSYRLNTTYFHEKPITPQVLDRAFSCCQLV